MRIRETYAAGIPKVFAVIGNFFRLQEATAALTGSVDVKFWRGGRLLSVDMLAADPGDWCRALPDGFDQIEITSSAVQIVAFQVLRGDVGSDRITGNVAVTTIAGGTVSVVEGGKARVLAGNAYICGGSLLAVGGQYSIMQLWNAGALRNLIVNKILVSSSSLGNAALLFRHVAALSGANMFAQNKLLGGPVSTHGQVRSQNNATNIGTQLLASSWIQPGAATHIPLIEPIIIPPGHGLNVGSHITGVDFNCSWDFWEEAI